MTRSHWFMQSLTFYVAIGAFMGGVLLRSLLSLPPAAFFSGALLTCVCTLWWWRRRRSWLLIASVLLTGLTLGVLRMDIASSSVVSQHGGDVAVTGVVLREPEQRERTLHVYVRTEDEYVLAYLDRTAAVHYGDRVTLTGELQTPQSFVTDLGRTFNYPGYLEARGVSQVMFYPEVAVTDSAAGSAYVAALLSFKDRFKTALRQVVPDPESSLGEGLLLGEKAGLGEHYETVFRRTGIIHIVVLSGYNVMLVVAFMTTVLSFLLYERARFFFSLLAVISFAVIVGLSATVVRASVMAGFILWARYTGARYAVLRALCLAAVLMVLHNPHLLAFDPGFQLSFIATVGLIWLAPLLERFVLWVPETLDVRSFLVATVATQLFVLPFLLYQIGEVSVVSVLVNVLVLPMVPVAMLLTFAAGLVAMVSVPLGIVVGYAASLSLRYILAVSEYFAAVPFAAYTVPPFSVWVMVLGYALLGFCVYRLTRHFETDPLLRGWTIVGEYRKGPKQSFGPKGAVFFSSTD